MSKNQTRHIDIDRLEIRLRRGDANFARELSASLGEEILHQMAQQTSVARDRRSTRIGQVDAGTLRVGRDARGSQARTAIARQIATQVSAKIAPITSRNKG
jgi:hypothetical protein